MSTKVISDASAVVCAGYENGGVYWWDIRVGCGKRELMHVALHSEPGKCCMRLAMSHNKPTLAHRVCTSLANKYM